VKDDTTNKKTVWNDVTKIWGRVAGVIAGVGVAATFVTKGFNTSPELTYSLFALIGVVLLLVSFYVDKQSEYTHQEIIKYEHQAREDFSRIIEAQKKMSDEYRRDTERRIQYFVDSVEKLTSTTEETRRDTLRIQLMMLMRQEDKNIDTILKVAETYFRELHGDWYMTSEFSRWAEKHEISIPPVLYQAMEENHKTMK